MEFLIISVQDTSFGFDAVHRVELAGGVYYIRFTYNDTDDSWNFSLYDSQMEPIMLSIKIVPRFPLDIFVTSNEKPAGLFVAITDLDRIGRDDFQNGKAKFAFFPDSGTI